MGDAVTEFDASMFNFDSTVPSLDDTAHIIQVALTPVFLLTGIANLLAVFSMRLARISDRVDYLVQQLAKANPKEAEKLKVQFRHLHHRSLTLDVAVILGALAGAATCGAALVLFIAALHNKSGTAALFSLFGAAVLCTIGSLIAFLTEVLMAGRNLRVGVAARWHIPPP